MILVPNRQQRLNGSKISLFAILFCFLVSSCGLFNPATPQVDNRVDKRDDEVAVQVDTVKWKQADQKNSPPIGWDEKKADNNKTGDQHQSAKKARYTLAAFLPFESDKMNFQTDDLSTIKNYKYLHYYAGMKLAIDDLNAEDINLDVYTFDSKNDKNRVQSVLENEIPRNVDVIMGSLKKDELMATAIFGQKHKIPVISPWYSSQSVADKNPYYIQFTPFLVEHYNALVEHALNNFDAEQIYLLGRQGSKEPSRFKYFQAAAFNLTGKKDALNEFVFNTDELTYEHEILKAIIDRQNTETVKKPTVFIVPNFSPREAKYIYNLLRRINVEKMENEVYVYGMPVLYTLDKISYEYYTNLNIRMAMSRFPDRNSMDAKRFNGIFYRAYNEFPVDEAYEGYDNMMFVGRMLHKYGKDFIQYLDQDEKEYLTTRFNIKPKFELVDERPVLDYYENKNLRIIEYVDNQFTTIK